jgi:hypothetical protein
VLVDGSRDLTVVDGAIDRVAVGEAREGDLDAVFRGDLGRDEIDQRLLGGVALRRRDREGCARDIRRGLRRVQQRDADRRDDGHDDDGATRDPGPATALLEFESVIGLGVRSRGRVRCDLVV